MKKYFIIGFFILFLLIVRAFLLIEISALESEISNKKNELAEIEKEFKKNNVIYSEKSDIDKISEEMQKNYNMEISSSINYFKISGDNGND
ncbi:MAG: hypothetical protein LBT51_07230 [Fusobacteriaceae bacterium]|jgi:hypothetical protein|nr:hypothetical protein [Fusobacteriaceae bacterium]